MLPVAALTCDVEDYYHVSAFESVLPPVQWGRYPPRVAHSTQQVLNILEQAQVRGTFFILGVVAQQNPNLVRAIAHAGHEVASHGWNHTRVDRQTPNQFAADVQQTRALLQDLSGQAVLGYRAASFSMGAHTPFAHSVLAQAGHTYSSSVYPAAHDHYGDPTAPRAPHWPQPNVPIIEYPPSVLQLLGRDFACGGGFFRLLPRALFNRALAAHRAPAVFYIHPWEFDPQQPYVKGVSWRKQLRHRVGLRHTAAKVRALLPLRQWCTMHELVMRYVEV